eukprot:gene12425-6181_t
MKKIGATPVRSHLKNKYSTSDKSEGVRLEFSNELGKKLIEKY